MDNDDLKADNEHDSYVMENLREDLGITENLLAERQKVLDAIPECPVHGIGCVPHALEWIEKMKDLERKDKKGYWVYDPSAKRWL